MQQLQPSLFQYQRLCLEQNSEFPISVVTVSARLRGQKVGDSNAVVDDLAVYEHPIIFRFILAHELLDWLPAY